MFFNVLMNNKFFQTLIFLSIRFYAKKVLLKFDNYLNHLTSDLYIVKCEECRKLSFFL